MTGALIPHFAFPLRFAGGAAAVNEQGSPEEISDAVAAIAAHPRGIRIEQPRFGVTDSTFRESGPDLERVIAEVREWEPRAQAADAAAAAAALSSTVTIDPKGAAG